METALGTNCLVELVLCMTNCRNFHWRDHFKCAPPGSGPYLTVLLSTGRPLEEDPYNLLVRGFNIYSGVGYAALSEVCSRVL